MTDVKLMILGNGRVGNAFLSGKGEARRHNASWSPQKRPWRVFVPSGCKETAARTAKALRKLNGSLTVAAVLQATRTVPIVFPFAVDPVGAGLVDSLARPGGNAAGFMVFEFSVGGKWLELSAAVSNTR
jgi:ABC transporter substrate binding protein